MRIAYKQHGIRFWSACEGCQRHQRACRGGVAGRVSCAQLTMYEVESASRCRKCRQHSHRHAENIVQRTGWHNEDANAPNEHAAVELLAGYSAAQPTVHDCQSATLVPPLQQMPSACASATDGIVHGIGSHVRSASIGRACRSGSAGLAFAAHFTVQDTEWNTLVTPLPQKLSACTPVTDGMVQRSGSHVTAPDVLSEHAASRHCASLTLAVLRALLP